MSTTFTMRIDEGQKTLISEYAAAHGQSMADFLINSALDIIEDATDLRDWNEAYEEYKADPVTYTLDEVMEEFGMR